MALTLKELARSKRRHSHQQSKRHKPRAVKAQSATATSSQQADSDSSATDSEEEQHEQEPEEQEPASGAVSIQQLLRDERTRQLGVRVSKSQAAGAVHLAGEVLWLDPLLSIKSTHLAWLANDAAFAFDPHTRSLTAPPPVNAPPAPQQQPRTASAAPSNEQQRNDAATAPSNEQQHNDAATSSSNEQQHNDAATASSNEQQRNDAATASSNEQQRNDAATAPVVVQAAKTHSNESAALAKDRTEATDLQFLDQLLASEATADDHLFAVPTAPTSVAAPLTFTPASVQAAAQPEQPASTSQDIESWLDDLLAN